ncbi:hypothetical protein NP493_92g01011 [Ridgeia piscesae]|uniref:Sec1 family domain-containing protein 2 n=1 Tax=Ridgeia piscesae TaxID=27915 RepID=A0AAD9UHP8_RIDPI|nr:hypothetical protein NP493_92g01011 [Ridgeia piscesae]
MSSGDFLKMSRSSLWENVQSKVNKATVFLDDVVAECLHWNGGATLLFNSGAVDVKQFSSFECAESSVKKAVFLVSGALMGTSELILRDIIQASSFQYVIVICTLLPGMQTLLRYGGVDNERMAFEQLEDLMLQWMGNMNYTVELMYLPLVTAPVTSRLFFLPEHVRLFPLLPTDLYALQQLAVSQPKRSNQTNDLEMSQLPQELQLRLKGLVCSLNATLEQLSLTEDIYSLGPTSRMVAVDLANFTWAKTRRKTAEQKASLLLIDRTLDMSSAIGHHADSLLDRILRVLPALPSHNVDISVDMSPLCNTVQDPDHEVIMPGCLGHPSDTTASALLNTIASCKHKEGVMEVHRQLTEAGKREGVAAPPPERPGKVSPEQLHEQLMLFKQNNQAIHRNSGLLQIAMATFEALKCTALSKQDSLLGVEKGLIQCLGEDDTAGTLSQLTQTLSREGTKLYTLEDIFCLLVYVYSMAGDDLAANAHNERRLMTALTSVIAETNQDNLPEFIKPLVDTMTNEEEIGSVLEELFYKLRGLGTARKTLKQFSTICEGGGLTSQASMKPLLKQVIHDIVNPSKPELVDIEYKSTGLRDLLKTGFGFFMNVSKPRPSDHPVLIVFVIGGVTVTEARQIQEVVSATKSNMQVLVGSTSIVTPPDLLHMTLAQNHLNPV